jgi:hypothetical protein
VLARGSVGSHPNGPAAHIAHRRHPHHRPQRTPRCLTTRGPLITATRRRP